MDPNIHLIERRERRGRRLPSLALLAIITLLGSATFGLFAFLEANAAYGTAQDLEGSYICNPNDFELEFPDLSRLSTVYTTDGVLLGQLTERNSQPVAITEVPETVKYAVLAAEDADFYEHEGIDFKGILRAAVENARSDSGIQGGSTITQQVVKKNFLTDEVTLERKICEAVVAAELERRYTKDQILEFYMNSVFYGENAYGIKAAAQEYYDKDLEDVTIAEAAAMVVPIRNPSFYDLRDEPDRVTRARDGVIDQMVEHGFISEAEGEAAKEEPLTTAEHEDFVEISPQVVIAAREALLNDPIFGLGETFAERKLAALRLPGQRHGVRGRRGPQDHRHGQPTVAGRGESHPAGVVLRSDRTDGRHRDDRQPHRCTACHGERPRLRRRRRGGTASLRPRDEGAAPGRFCLQAHRFDHRARIRVPGRLADYARHVLGSNVAAEDRVWLPV